MGNVGIAFFVCLAHTEGLEVRMCGCLLNHSCFNQSLTRLQLFESAIPNCRLDFGELNTVNECCCLHFSVSSKWVKNLLVLKVNSSCSPSFNDSGIFDCGIKVSALYIHKVGVCVCVCVQCFYVWSFSERHKWHSVLFQFLFWISN